MCQRLVSCGISLRGQRNNLMLNRGGGAILLFPTFFCRTVLLCMQRARKISGCKFFHLRIGHIRNLPATIGNVTPPMSPSLALPSGVESTWAILQFLFHPPEEEATALPAAYPGSCSAESEHSQVDGRKHASSSCSNFFQF